MGVLEYRLLDKYTIKIREEDMAYKPGTEHFDRGYFWFLTRKPGDVRRQSLCLEKLFQPLPELKTVVEFFGGVGLCSVLIHEIIKPRKHLIFDIDPFCVRHLQFLTKGWKGTAITEGDVFDVPLSRYRGADLYCFDFNSFTLNSLKGRLLENRTLDVTIKTGPRYVQITDSAINKFHINHKSYTDIKGQSIKDIEEYFNAFSVYAHARWGYSVTTVYYHFGASYLLLEPGEHKLKTVEKIT